MTVWAERVFFLNALLNFLLLLGSARLAGAPAPMRRVLPAAALGGVYAVAALVPALGFLQTAGMKAITAAVILLLPYSFPWLALLGAALPCFTASRGLLPVIDDLIVKE